nr:PREDICTED: coatomer subunit zeta-1 isoform X1 [Bos mutus]
MEALILEPSLYTVKAILILDNDGDRLFAKYYDDTYPSVKEQKAFEKNIFNKTHRTDSEIALLEGLTVVYKSSIDLYFYVIGSSYENELMLMTVLNCLFDSLSQMLRKNVEKRALLENMEGLFLAVDEIVDGGVILESDPQQVVHRVALRSGLTPAFFHAERLSLCAVGRRCTPYGADRVSGATVSQRTDQVVPPSVKTPLFLAPHPLKKSTSAVTCHAVPQMMLSGSSRGSQGSLNLHPVCCCLLIPTPNPYALPVPSPCFWQFWESIRLSVDLDMGRGSTLFPSPLD